MTIEVDIEIIVGIVTCIGVALLGLYIIKKEEERSKKQHKKFKKRYKKLLDGLRMVEENKRG